MNWNPKTRQSKKVGFRVLIYKEVQIKRKSYTVQEKEMKRIYFKCCVCKHFSRFDKIFQKKKLKFSSKLVPFLSIKIK